MHWGINRPIWLTLLINWVHFIISSVLFHISSFSEVSQDCGSICLILRYLKDIPAVTWGITPLGTDLVVTLCEPAPYYSFVRISEKEATRDRTRSPPTLGCRTLRALLHLWEPWYVSPLGTHCPCTTHIHSSLLFLVPFISALEEDEKQSAWSCVFCSIVYFPTENNRKKGVIY